MQIENRAEAPEHMLSAVTVLQLSVAVALRAAMCHRHRGADWGHCLPLMGRVQARGEPDLGLADLISLQLLHSGPRRLWATPLSSLVPEPLGGKSRGRDCTLLVCSWIPRASYRTWHIVSTLYMLDE